MNLLVSAKVNSFLIVFYIIFISFISPIQVRAEPEKMNIAPNHSFENDLTKINTNLCNYGGWFPIGVVTEDGSSEINVSDATWKASTGPILMSDIYNGEIYDARLEKKGWSKAGFNDQDWLNVEVVEYSKEILVAPVGPPVQKIEELKPEKPPYPSPLRPLWPYLS